MPDRPFVVGIQCHPEELARRERWAARLFEGLVAAASHL
jgi:gamma-glutamyl-gamma-aminobutyrate hydrolase PuuD